MNYKDYLEKYKGANAHFDLDVEGYYLLDFTCRSFANVSVLDVHDEYIVLYDQVDKSNMLVPYTMLLVRYPSDATSK